MLTIIESKLNRMAQGVMSESECALWFQSIMSSQRVEVLRVLASLCTQTHPKQEEVPAAIARSGLRVNLAPCVLLESSSRPEQAFAKIISLPPSEEVNAFRLLAALFAIADTRRRQTQFRDGCAHEWHHLALD